MSSHPIASAVVITKTKTSQVFLENVFFQGKYFEAAASSFRIKAWISAAS